MQALLIASFAMSGRVEAAARRLASQHDRHRTGRPQPEGTNATAR